MVYDFVKEYESVPYTAHLKWGPIQVRHHICYRTCIVVPVTDIAGRSPLNFFQFEVVAVVCVGPKWCYNIPISVGLKLLMHGL